MTSFIQVTFANKKPILINVSKILSVREYKGKVMIDCGGESDYVVTESYEQVLALITTCAVVKVIPNENQD